MTPSPLAAGPVTVGWEDGEVGLLFVLQRAAEAVPSGPVVAADTPASSFVDAAPDGRYVTPTASSVDVTTPGPAVSIAPVQGQVATCGARFSLPLSATGDGPVTWAPASAPRVLTASSGWRPGGSWRRL
ncbi:MAG: hypothetical protein IT380_16655 [Myxococcales bacterium]|nr:hypothetical protein [Myxococcales bacterium]